MIALEQNVKRLHETFSVEKMYQKFIEAMGEKEFDVENWLDSLDLNEIE
jgi:hypothetical protein